MPSIRMGVAAVLEFSFVPPRTSFFVVSFFALAALCVAFIANSHPFMFPGYDVWWHLGNISSASQPGATGYSGRFIWHGIWSRVFEFWPDLGLWERALVIHRVQFLLAAVLIWLAGYWVLSVIFVRAQLARWEVPLLALIGAVVWMLMLGTWSQAHAGGSESRVVLPWILWYSINYQIALPFCMLAVAALLYAVGMPLSASRRSLMLAICAVSVGTVMWVHAAEVPYFGLSAVFLMVAYLRGSRLWRLLPLLILLALIVGYVALQFSYRMPESVRLVMGGDWNLLTERVGDLGARMVRGKLNRAVTSWNTLHVVSGLLMLVALPLAWRLREWVSVRAMVFVLLTGLMPLALLFESSAGVLAMVTHLGIAWRFSFASLLFLGIPVFLGVLGVWLRQAGAWRQGGQVLAIIVIVLGVYSHTRWFDPAQVTRTFATALYRSLDPQKMYFGLSASEQAALDAMHHQLVQSNPRQPLCIDVFSAYYLFFLKDYRNVYMPANIRRLPIAGQDPHACPFPREGEDLASVGLTRPDWRFNLVRTLQAR